MPVTNYYSVKGRILSEATVGGSGVRGYGPDALGSVAATYDTNGLKENVYHYKPYGAQASKAGTAADPKFTWVGSIGYRQTGLSFSDLYVRARNYASVLARWTTQDLFWPDESAFSYPRSPVLLADPTGHQGTSGGTGLHPRSRCLGIDVYPGAAKCSVQKTSRGYSYLAYVKVTMLGHILTGKSRLILSDCDIYQTYCGSQVTHGGKPVVFPLGTDDDSVRCDLTPGNPAKGMFGIWELYGADQPGLYSYTGVDEFCLATGVASDTYGGAPLEKWDFVFTDCCNCPTKKGPSGCQAAASWRLHILVYPAIDKCDAYAIGQSGTPGCQG